MINIGKYNKLRIDRKGTPGLFLMDEEFSVLLPTKYITDDMKIDSEISVFVYKDNEGRPIATTLVPKVTVGQFASLEVMDVNRTGAFLDMGVEKDILLPFREQRSDLSSGDYVVVYIYLDEKTERLVATEKLNKFTREHQDEFSVGDQVNILIHSETRLGYKSIVNQTYDGMLYHNELFKDIYLGDDMKAFVKQVRPDGKLDLQLETVGYGHIDSVSQDILEALKKKGGFLALHDKSDPTTIKAELQISKKAFKKAIGGLYKAKRITIEKDGIRLVD